MNSAHNFYTYSRVVIDCTLRFEGGGVMLRTGDPFRFLLLDDCEDIFKLAAQNSDLFSVTS